MRVNARRIESQAGRKIILLTIEDITELKNSEKALQELSTRLLNIEDEQRRSFARDLHDDTGVAWSSTMSTFGMTSEPRI